MAWLLYTCFRFEYSVQNIDMKDMQVLWNFPITVFDTDQDEKYVN